MTSAPDNNGKDGTDKASPEVAKRSAVKQSKAPAISRAAAVLRLLGKSDAPLNLQSIASQLELVPSTCLNILRALVAEEFVAFDSDSKRYSLEAGVLTLARQWLRRSAFNDLAQPVLDRISRDRDITMLGVNIVGLEHIVVVAASQASNNLQISAQIGTRFPALLSATGRCIAAYGGYRQEEIKNRFDTLRWDDPPSWETWQRQVNETRERGYAVDAGNYIAGVTVLAAPVWNAAGKLRHALVGLGISSAVERRGLSELETDLLAAAKSLSQQLSGD